MLFKTLFDLRAAMAEIEYTRAEISALRDDMREELRRD